MGIEISQFTERELKFGKQLTDSEEWSRGVSDWKRLLSIEPKGFFKASLDGNDAGIIGSVRYDRVVWINSLIVAKEFRGRHVGEALMRHCLDHVIGSGATVIKLDSVPGVEPFYQKFGFRTEFQSLRFMGNVNEIGPPASGVFRPELEEITRLDREELGIDRGKILRALFEEPTGRCFACGEKKGITGYLLTRQGLGRVDLGPCVVKDGDIGVAEDLLRAATSIIPSTNFKLCVPGINTRSAGLIKDLGFKQIKGTTRMSTGEPFDEPFSMISMMSPEKG